jgi:hypothetical protein
MDGLTEQQRRDRRAYDEMRDRIARGHDPSDPPVRGPLSLPGPHDCTLTPDWLYPGQVEVRCDSCGRWLTSREPDAAEAYAARHKQSWKGAA